jgi:hypothetical protein
MEILLILFLVTLLIPVSNSLPAQRLSFHLLQ